MKVASVLLFCLIFVSPWVHAETPDSSLQSTHKNILQLLAAEEFGTIRALSISEVEDGKLAINLTVDIGECWGKESIAKDVAKRAMEKLYQSGFPISEVVAKIVSRDTSLIILALGKNQAEKIHWDEIKTGKDFIDHLKSNYSGSINVQRIEDHCIVVEHSRTSRPSPL